MSTERLTVFVCANMDGTEKRKLIFIGKSATPRCFKNLQNLPVTYSSNKKAWITPEIFMKMLSDWDGEMMKQKRQILLLVDNCPTHPKVPNLKCIELVFLPPNVTAVLQPMDQGVILCLKSYYRQQLLLKLMTSLDSGVGFKITVLDAIMMLVNAWGRVSSKTISHCFHHSGLRSEFGFDEEDELPLTLWIDGRKLKN